jgi:hypothetical protein
VLIRVDLPATAAAPAMARRLMEKFLLAHVPPIGTRDQVHALLLVDELVTAVIEYGSTTTRHLALSLMRRGRILTATLGGDDGVALVALEMMDESLRGSATTEIVQIAHRWGANPDPEDRDLIWVELDLEV